MIYARDPSPMMSSIRIIVWAVAHSLEKLWKREEGDAWSRIHRMEEYGTEWNVVLRTEPKRQSRNASAIEIRGP